MHSKPSTLVLCGVRRALVLGLIESNSPGCAQGRSLCAASPQKSRRTLWPEKTRGSGVLATTTTAAALRTCPASKPCPTWLGGMALLKSGRAFFNLAYNVNWETSRISPLLATTCDGIRQSKTVEHEQSQRMGWIKASPAKRGSHVPSASCSNLIQHEKKSPPSVLTSSSQLALAWSLVEKTRVFKIFLQLQPDLRI